ncbi:hypothetical protein B4U80_09906 [Leptotrombidium deliense]|uniref:Uncharacterized protein n=1 Tax=Leptotrombidium deliense TaxID=299467 RepID=A0A443RZ85_9ACAR|nr:hypothetical protein B4U80_09906 [Leptotrombidium deliense]
MKIIEINSILLILLIAYCSLVLGQRPFWIIGHMANSKSELINFLDAGANAIEADVTFNSTGSALITYHGVPCDCFRHCHSSCDINDYLKFVRNITTKNSTEYRQNFTLLLLDLKTHLIDNKHLYNAGVAFAKTLYFNLFNSTGKESTLRVLLAVEQISHQNFILGFLNETKRSNFDFENRIGWQISENANYAKIYEMWKNISDAKNIWYSDGISNCVIFYRPKERGRDLLVHRDICNTITDAYCPRKIYMWTVDYYNQLWGLWNHIDAVITNNPWEIKRLVNSRYMKQLRLATVSDDPWEKYSTWRNG